MPAILSRISILFIHYILCNLDYPNIVLYKLFFRYLVVKPACVNAALALPISAPWRQGNIAAFGDVEALANLRQIWPAQDLNFKPPAHEA